MNTRNTRRVRGNVTYRRPADEAFNRLVSAKLRADHGVAALLSEES